MKKLTKKLVMLAVCGLSMGAVNAQTWNIGTPTATDVTAILDTTSGTLTISGIGKMQDFPSYNAPWHSVCSSITTLVIQSGVTNIGNYAFANCYNITGTLTIPSTVTSIGDYSFHQCEKIAGDLSIPNLVNSIGEGAFMICQSLTSMTIPASVNSIHNYAFTYCSGLTSITCLNPNPAAITLGGVVFDGVPVTTCVLKVPCSSVAAYHTAPQWSDFTNIEAIPEPHTILATAGTGGTISPMGAIAVNCADSQTFTFSANSGYEISQVLIDNLNNFPAVAAGTYTFTNIQANHKIEVSFKTITGISEATAEKMTIYPSPTSGQLRVSEDILDGKDREIRIFNVVGQVVFTSPLSKLSPETTINISYLSAGLYFLKVNGKMVKIIKE